jgi:hypothetical protein
VLVTTTVELLVQIIVRQAAAAAAGAAALLLAAAAATTRITESPTPPRRAVPLRLMHGIIAMIRAEAATEGKECMRRSKEEYIHHLHL